ncbi:B3 domain-containing transcription factor VRN1-like isoform X2 [Mercurialis annua]|uniref:B3 domain-containing transcription factor VRN1-like isoform X2 n=1 Tax=Mercurialis annua TaxID=3986 RepID=UPI00215E0621|nr:B3 domain-containing transcription factor VRN1-like isoform X2 [Mercurialis annua]
MHLLSDDGRMMMFKSKTPHFFKIILDDVLGDGKLYIPRKFVRLYGNNLPLSVVLKVPGGAKWKLELVKSDGEIWFQNGWQEFVKYYSIAYGSFLVFEYNYTNSQFNVTIFDTSTLEIDYPLDITIRNNEESHLETQIHDETEILSHKTKGKSTLLFPHTPNKKIKLERSTRKEEGNRAETLTAEVKSKALKIAASNFKSKNPFFMVAMRPTYLHRRANYRLSIPANFGKTYFNKQQGSAILRIDANLWPVEYKCYASVGRATLNKGWKEFAIINHLEIGDVCVFELIDPTNTTLEVAIFRHIKEAIKSPSLGNNKKMKQEERCGDEKSVHRHLCLDFSKAVEAANKFTSVNPFFKANISSSLSTVSIPLEFAVKCSKKNTENVWLQIGNRMWAVKLIINRASYGRGWLSAGFSLFAKENCLKAGDVCIFELINTEMLLLKVSIFRNIEK